MSEENYRYIVLAGAAYIEYTINHNKIAVELTAEQAIEVDKFYSKFSEDEQEFLERVIKPYSREV